MIIYIRYVDFTTELRAGKTVYAVRHVADNNGSRFLFKTYHFDVRPTRAQAEAAGQTYVDNLNARIEAEQNAPKTEITDKDMFEIKERLNEIVRLGITPTQILNRLNTEINDMKAQAQGQ